MDPYKARKAAKVIAIIIAVAMIITSFSFVMMVPGIFGMKGSVVYAGSGDEYLDREMENLKQYMEYIRDNYKDSISYEQLIDGAFEGVVNSLEDPYSVYYGSSGDGEDFIDSVSGEFSGIGLSLENYNGLCRVVAPIPGTPAEKSGIKTGDIVTKVDNIDISSKTLDEAAAMMRGEAGTKVTITIDRNGQAHTFHLTREKIKTVSVTYKMLEDKIGYIQITSFDNDSNLEFRLAKKALINQGADSLIIDVRNNPGGLVNTALEIAKQLMPKGPITHFEQKGKIVESYYADGLSALKIPAVLLVNEGSASSSEILAGALQDSKTAILVGTVTFGKGIAQQITEAENGASTKLSMYYFLTPNKNRIDKVGISPDYIISESVNINADELAAKYAGFAPMSEKTKPKAGETGLNVFGAQQRLSMLGYTVSTSGTMDEETVAAIKKFQKENGLYPYGILDYSTKDTIDKVTIDFITGAKNKTDLQLNKAIELLE